MAKILIVDDSETARIRLRQELESAGHNVLEAENGLDGIETLTQNPDANIVITDVNMPKMDGITMCEHISEKPELKKVLLFVLTTEFDPALKAKGKNAGVKLWVTKPVNPQGLLKIIDKVMGR